MIVRCIRIFFMYKLSTQKTTIYEGKRKSSKPPIDASTSQTDSRTQMNSLKPTTIAATTSSLTTPTMINGLNSILTMENSLEKTTCNNNDGETATLSEKSSQIQHEQNYPHVVVATPTSDVMMSVMTNSNNFDTTTTTTTSTTAATTTTTNMIHVEMKDISIDHHPNDTSSNKDTNRDTAESKYEDTEPMDEDSRSWFTAELESEISQNNVEMKKLKFYRALVSYKFILALYAILFFVHLAIWAIFGAADEAVYQQSGKHVFLWNVGMFVFDTGCVTNTNTVFLLAAEAFFYIIVEIVFIIMLFFADRDTWGIKKETFVLLIIQICTALAYLICGQIEGIRFLTDYFVPYGFTLLTYSLVEVFISVVLPVCYAISHDRKEKATYAESEVELLLKNKKAFALLLDFATRSYCSEDILAYQDFEKYKKMSSRNRKKLALTLLNKYLKSGAPLELNISGLDQKRAILEKIISDLPVPPRDLFEEIKILCLNNMIDVFERLKASNMEVREMVSNYKRASRTEPKVQNSD
nr:unnamed protein product [Naegleria fowleri]